MEEVIMKSLVGTGGFFATLSLAPISEVVSLLVGVATLVYMIVSISKPEPSWRPMAGFHLRTSK